MADTDQVLVYDGQSETSSKLGTFYGGNPPPSTEILSSSNHMLVIFKSDSLSNDYSGFKANYSAGNLRKTFYMFTDNNSLT